MQSCLLDPNLICFACAHVRIVLVPTSFSKFACRLQAESCNVNLCDVASLLSSKSLLCSSFASVTALKHDLSHRRGSRSARHTRHSKHAKEIDSAAIDVRTITKLRTQKAVHH